jgi:hypothetical protein
MSHPAPDLATRRNSTITISDILTGVTTRVTGTIVHEAAIQLSTFHVPPLPR